MSIFVDRNYKTCRVLIITHGRQGNHRVGTAAVHGLKMPTLGFLGRKLWLDYKEVEDQQQRWNNQFSQAGVQGAA